MITQCPSCQTRFRLPLDQVASSRGEVLCGECRAQFNALDYLVIEDGLKSEKPTLTERASKADEKENSNTLFLPIDEDVIANLLSEGSTGNDHETGELENVADVIQQPVEEESPQLTPIAQSTAPAFTDTLIQQALQAGEDNKQVNSLVEQESPEPQKEAQKEPAKIEAQIEVIEVSEASPPSTPPTPRPSNPESTNYQLDRGLDAPAAKPHAVFWPRLLSTTVILLLISTLGFQYLVAQRDHFAQNRYFRPLLTSICPQLGCSIAPKRELSLLSIVDTRIETHPQYPDALLISAGLNNQGGFEQHYPIVELVMTNIQQEVVASRRFYPDEYLPDFSNKRAELFSADSINSMQLEVVDPGSHATGFEFILHNRTF